MLKDENRVMDLIQTEMRSNLHILIDPKKKNSFSDSRVNTWIKITSERFIHHLFEKNSI